MNIANVMTKPPATCNASDSVAEAAKRMLDHDIGYLPVADHGKVSGVITDRDIVLRAVAAGKPADTTPVREVMTHQVHTIAQDRPVEDAARHMQSNKVRRLLAVGPEGAVVGVVSVGDIAAKHPDLEHAGETIRACCC